MLGRVPEVEDALGAGEVLAEEFFQAVAAVRQRDLMFGLIPTHLRRLTPQLQAKFVQLVKTGQIPHAVRRYRSLVVLATRVVEQADIRHATIRFRAAVSLLSYSGGIQADISAGLAVRVSLPSPRLAFAKRHLVLEQLGQPLSGPFGDTLD